MFYKTPFNQALNPWNVSSVTRMDYMFYGASVFNRQLHDWDVSSVTDMSYMFVDTTKFNRIYTNLP